MLPNITPPTSHPLSFFVIRNFDESGVSGTGKIIEGVLFENGQTVIHWLTPRPNGSIAVWNSYDEFLDIHVRSHPTNRTEIYFIGGARHIISETSEKYIDASGQVGDWPTEDPDASSCDQRQCGCQCNC